MTIINDINNTAIGGSTTPVPGDKTFSQAELDRIIGERLAKEKAKTDAAIADREKELAQRELALTAKELLTEKALPVELLEALNFTSKEAMEKSVTIIEEVINKVKAERPKITFKGAVPAASGNESADQPADLALKKAMGLLK